MKRAWQFLLDNLEYNNSIMLLREYDKIVGELLFNCIEEIRTIPVQIGGTSREPEMPHTGIIMDSIKQIEQIKDVELRVLKYFCYITRTQMFIDGNGRTSRLIMNYQLMINGFLPVSIAKKNRLEYYNTLEEYAVNENLEQFLELIATLEEE